MAKKPVVTALKPSELTWTCPHKLLPFKTTRELKPLHRIVGQDRAVEAVLLGARIRSQGYNIWASGVVGTGRMTTVRQCLDDAQQVKPQLWDFAYVYNFVRTDQPVLLRFHAGEGRVFCRMVDDAVVVLSRRITQLFEEEQFQADRKNIIHRFQAQEQQLLSEFDQKLRPEGFVLGQIQNEDGSQRTEIFPFIDNKPLSFEELDELFQQNKITADELAKIRDQYEQYREQLNEIGSRSLRIMASFRKELGNHDRAAVGVLIKSILDDVRQSFPRDRVAAFLDGMTEHILNNLEDYVRVNSARLAGQLDEGLEETARKLDLVQSVNLIVDNYDQKTAPVVVETTPTYASMFGTIERRVDMRGNTFSEFNQIKAGSLIRADGGFLVMNAMDVLTDANLWNALKKVLLYGRLELQPIDTQFQLNTLKPEWVKVTTKVILLGDASIYLALWEADEDFRKIFKVHAQFDDQTDRTQHMINNYAAFFAKMATEEDLLHCDTSGAAALIEWAVAYTDSQDKITLQFSTVADLMREAVHYAHQSGANLVSRTHVRTALEQRRWRSNSVDEQLREAITKGRLLIDVSGRRVGQINGLTVYQSGIMAYGKPSRITATVSAGNAGIINIEREVDLSGAIHNKGVLILSGLLRSIFSRAQPMSFTASIAFEQSYGGVDGDSASAAEIIALLSAIGNIPIRQDLAITGSINQKGDVQPIGGINEKVTGFFEVCQDRGLTGTQGVVLPYQNVRDLMLRDDIIEAVRKHQFFLYPVHSLDQAIEVMVDMPTGGTSISGQFPKDTVYAKVKQNLDVLHEASRHRQ